MEEIPREYLFLISLPLSFFLSPSQCQKLVLQKSPTEERRFFCRMWRGNMKEGWVRVLLFLLQIKVVQHMPGLQVKLLRTFHRTLTSFYLKTVKMFIWKDYKSFPESSLIKLNCPIWVWAVVHHLNWKLLIPKHWVTQGMGINTNTTLPYCEGGGGRGINML